MARQSRFQHYSLTQAKRKTLTIASFGGVDYSTQKFNISNSRAIDLKNFVYKDGVIQKRSGFEEIFKIKPTDYFKMPEKDSGIVISNENTTNINNIWKFLAEDGKEHIVAHIGKLLYEVKNIGKDNMKVEVISIANLTLPVCYEFEDYKSMAFVGNNRLWFLGGNKFMCLRFTDSGASFYPVANAMDRDEDERPFIPTTTIGITYEHASVSERSGLDYPNMLNMFRKNMCVTGVGKDETEKTKTDYFTYTLDAPLVFRKPKDMKDFRVTIKERGVIE